MVSDDDLARLSGRSVLVADDDPDVRGLFEKTLRKVGMTVRSVKDGQAALEALRESPPDVIITDIFMPRVDGWELLARLRRDFNACHIPTIILSWKEDLLERVKDLKAGASGYMLKEADRKQILYTVARALLPRLTLEKRIVEEEEIMGRVERVGVLPLLATAMQLRQSCRVHITEHWNFYEAHIADGEIVAVTRTATDGSFSSGQKALERLVGVATGRFAVIPPSASTPKRQIDGGTWNAIDIAAEKLTILVSRLVDTGFTENTKIVIDDEEATTYGRILPPSLGALLSKLRSGKSLRDIVLESDSSADVLETLLVDLVRAGVIVDVRSETGTTIPPPPLSASTEAQPRQPVDSETSFPPSRSSGDFALSTGNHPEQPAETERLEALERKMGFYRGASVVLLVLCLSLATSLAIHVWLNYSSPSVKTPASSLETHAQEATRTP
jgi:CheY-like chemotaxis protein